MLRAVTAGLAAALLGMTALVVAAPPASAVGDATITPDSLDFGNRATPDTRTLTYTSTGDTPAEISDVTSNDPAFVASAAPGCSSVAPGNTCDISVTFTPTAGQTDTGTITVTDNTADSPRTVEVTGSELAVADVEPLTLAFGSRRLVDGPTASQQVSVTNTGVVDLHVTALDTGSPEFTATGCSGTVIPTASCTVEVVFDPLNLGLQTETLTITTDGGVRTVDLTGTGTEGALSTSVPGLSFGTVAIGSTKTMTATLTNTGTGYTVLGLPAMTGSARADYRLNSAAQRPCVDGLVLLPTATCRATVVFGPRAVGSRPATLTLSGDDSGSHPITLSGTGVDLTKPTVLERSPVDGTTNVIRTAAVRVTFSELVKGVRRDTFTLNNHATGAKIRAVVTRQGTTNRWVLDPTSTLRANTRFTARLVGGASAIRDQYDNTLNSTSWSFRTR